MGGDSGPTAWENLGGSRNSAHKSYKIIPKYHQGGYQADMQARLL